MIININFMNDSVLLEIYCNLIYSNDLFLELSFIIIIECSKIIFIKQVSYCYKFFYY